MLYVKVVGHCVIREGGRYVLIWCGTLSLDRSVGRSAGRLVGRSVSTGMTGVGIISLQLEAWTVQRTCVTHSCYCVVNSSTTIAPVKSTRDAAFVDLSTKVHRTTERRFKCPYSIRFFVSLISN